MSNEPTGTGGIDPQAFFAVLKREQIGPFVGVPCSLIQSLIAYAADHPQEAEFLFPAHESHAMAIASGTWMGSKGAELPMVFLQNSGFGNIINPLTSLHQIYDIPAILLVTWRAEKGYGTDAPEHWIVGRDMEAYFHAFNLPYRILSQETWEDDIAAMKAEALRTKKPTVICVKKGAFATYKRAEPATMFPCTGKDAVLAIKNHFPDAAFLSTTGMLSRESFTVKDTPDFYMMGSMGLIAGVAAGVASRTDKKVIALDGDGAVLMHMGLLPFIGHERYANLLHVVLDNEAYGSTGGQPTVSPTVDFCAAALACGYKTARKAENVEQLGAALAALTHEDGPALLWVKISRDYDHHIGRVSDKYTCPQVTERFSDHCS